MGTVLNRRFQTCGVTDNGNAYYCVNNGPEVSPAQQTPVLPSRAVNIVFYKGKEVIPPRRRVHTWPRKGGTV